MLTVEEIDREIMELLNSIISFDKKIKELQAQKQKLLDSVSIQSLLDKYDFDEDGVISVIDMSIPILSILGELDNDENYDSVNKTYNGKSIDLNQNGEIDIVDQIALVNRLKADLNGGIDLNIDNFDGYGLDLVNIYVTTYHELPNLQQLKDITSKNKVYNLISYSDSEGTNEYATGSVRTTKTLEKYDDMIYIQVEVTSNSIEGFVGLNFYIQCIAKPDGETVSRLYDNELQPVDIWVKISELQS